MHRYTVELRIAGGDLDPEEVTRTLGIAPTQVRRKGERRSETSVWPDSMWSRAFSPTEGDEWPSLADGLAALLSTANPLQSRIHTYLAAYAVYAWCGHFTSSFDGGPVLPPEILRSLGELGIQLVLDTYCESPK